MSGFDDEHGINLRSDHLAMQRLHEAAEVAKLELCSAASASISLPFISADAAGPKHLELSLTRARFDALVEPTLAATLEVCEGVLRQAALGTSDLDGVLLVGGTARASAVEQRAAAFFGRPPLKTSRPEEAVALGAAAQAQRLQEQQYRSAAG